MARIIDLSLPMHNFSNLPTSWQIVYWDHEEGTGRIGKSLGLGRDDFPDGLGLAMEQVTALTHAGTHLDAPYHYGPRVRGERALTIDEVPLEWCYGDGVVLDLHHKKAGELITEMDVRQAVEKIRYQIKEGDIVLIRTDAYKYYGRPEYIEMGPGMGREATLWVVNQGVRVMGCDSYNFDRPIPLMAGEHRAGKQGALWPTHMLGREVNYIHLESMANLDKIPVPFGFKVAVFPINIKRASGAWVRAVAILE